MGDIADLERPAVEPSLWPLDPSVVFLNHGSFGSCPRAVLDFQQQIRLRLERQPVRFFVRDLERLLDETREKLAAFLDADAEDLVLVSNATAGVNTVLRSLRFERGEELLVTTQEYNACRNALDFVAAQTGARVLEVSLPFPLQSADEVGAAILEKVTPRTRLALLDHVTSQTGLVLPLETILPALAERGVATLVDGAHAPGMIPLSLRRLGANYYTGNCHKWLNAPKGAGFLYVRRDLQTAIRPLAISHGANSPRSDRSRFQIEFGWTGTHDPSAWLAVPEAIRYTGALLPGGWPEIRARNRRLALAARALLCQALRIAPPAPEEMIGSLAALPLPDSATATPPTSPLYLDPLQDCLLERHGIEVPVIPWPKPQSRILRISAQLYNSLPQYRRLAEILPGLWPAAGN